MKSESLLKHPEFSFNRSLYKALGYSDDDLSRPIIGIANSWSTVVPGSFNLNILSDYVKRGIYRAGGTAVEFGVIGMCDGIAQGHEGMRHILPSRELISQSIIAMAIGHQLDGLVLLGSCDKIVPGMLMAAAELDITSILLPGGPMRGGIPFQGLKSDTTTVSIAMGMLADGNITNEDYQKLEEGCSPTYGSCAFLGTANTMCSISEAMGMTLPGGALIPSYHADRIRTAVETGVKICELVEKDITTRKIINEKSLKNAVAVCQAIGGSTNAVIHLCAIAHAAGLDLDVLRLFNTMRDDVPFIVKVNPSAKWDMEDFWKSGGIPRVMSFLDDRLEKDALTCTARKVKDNLKSYNNYRYPNNYEIIRDIEKPFDTKGGIAVLYGNLAPDGAISKPGAIAPEILTFRGIAKVFNSEEEAENAILDGTVGKGDVVVIRCEGPKGGPGMREMFKAMKYIKGRKLDKDVALITDGRFSGTNTGCFVGHISPEAAEGGPIAIVENGDAISIDVLGGKLTLDLTDEEIKARLEKWHYKGKDNLKGFLKIYSKLASSADKGAIIDV